MTATHDIQTQIDWTPANVKCLRVCGYRRTNEWMARRLNVSRSVLDKWQYGTARVPEYGVEVLNSAAMELMRPWTPERCSGRCKWRRG